MAAIGGLRVLRGGPVGEIPVKRGVDMRGIRFVIFFVVLLGAAAVLLGCDGAGWTSTPLEGGGSGTGGSGGDLFSTTTTGGAGGAAVCTGTCIAGKPAWFDGLSLFWIGAPDEAPPCSDLGLTEGSVGYADPIAPITCPTCSCAPAECNLPEEMHASAAKCPAGGAASIPFDAPPGWEGTCNSDDPIPGGLQCSGVACVQSISVAAATVACKPVADSEPLIPPVAWGTVARECVIWPISGEGCATGEACVPVPAAGYAACLYRHGDHSSDPGFECPAAYPRSMVVYSSYADNRACAPCACGTPDGACEALISVYKDGACGQAAASVMVSTEQGGCVDLLNGTALGSKSASLIFDQPGSCAPSGGALAGDLEPADPVTLCCQPDTAPAN